MSRKLINILTLVLLLFIYGCSAQKNTGLSRAYHNLTAKYNVLFNGNESYKDGLDKIDEQYKDDYAKLLPIFRYSGKDVASFAGSDMDRTIKKCSKLITLHSITAKPKVKNNKSLSDDERAFFNKKEYNAFVDDAYLLMGKAHFYKQEFILASDIFRKIVNDFKGQPAVYEAQIWIARLALETGQFIEASDILSMLNNNSDFPKKLLPELYPSYADYYLKQKDYASATNFLEKALTIEKSKKLRTRYTFILAQLYEKTGDLQKASVYYTQVIKMNPTYEMAFNAHINRALAYEQGFGQAEDIEGQLTKMLHDDKNTDYLDQIYYALGNLATKEGDEKKALEYYTRSIEVSKGNPQQQIRSYLTLADYYYAVPDYPKAQAYYDSAVIRLNPDFPGYNMLFTKSKSLTRLVNEINIVTLGDSVMKLSALPKDELNKLIEDIIADERKKEEETRLRQQNEMLDEQFGQEISDKNERTQQAAQSTQWYFYNDAARSMGYREFKLKFGNRRLEDHWQRASKAMIATLPGSTEEEVAEGNEAGSSESDNKLSHNFYMQHIPFSDSAKNIIYSDIESALYKMGMIYKDELKDFDKANESFKELIRRYPSSEFLLASYYNLYTVAREQNNLAMMDFYKGLIVSKFPDSMYAKILINPEYFRELEREDREIRQYYEQTYALYQTGNYADVIARSRNAIRENPSHNLVPQFTYLSLLAEGKSADRKVFRDSLIAVSARFPETEIAIDAKNLIRYMDQEHPEIKEAEEIKISQELYEYSPLAKHYFVFAVDKRMNTNQLVFNIINYNLDHSDSLNLIVEVVDINRTQNLITVRTFINQQQVLQYMQGITASEAVLKDIPEISFTPFMISVKNLETLRKDRSVERYLKFYNDNYR